MISIILVFTISSIQAIAINLNQEIENTKNNLKSTLKLLLDPPIEIEWKSTYPSSTSDCGIVIDQTNDGGYIIAISSIDSEEKKLINALKVNSNGNKIWSKTYGEGIPKTIQQTSDGGYILLSTNFIEENSQIQSKLIKLNADGSKKWEKKYGESDFDSLNEAWQTKDGNYILVGTKMNGLIDSDVWLIKTNSQGKILWQKTYGKSEGVTKYSDSGYSVYETKNGGYVIAGTTTKIKLVPPSSTTYAWIIKTDSTGKIIKESTFGETFHMSMYMPYRIIEDNQGNYIFAGSRNLESNYESSRFWILKTNSDLQKLYEYRNYNSREKSESINCINPTIDSGIIAVGSGFTINFPDISSYSILLKLDSKLKEEWNIKYGLDDDTSYVYYAKQTQDNGYIVSGGKDGDTMLIKYKGETPTQPPNKPNRPTGPSNGNAGVSYTYSTSTDDPAESKLYYWWDWGDGTNSGWKGPYDSGEIVKASHTWSAEGTYKIKVKAKNIANIESDWSDPLSVSMPKNKNRKINQLFSQIPYKFFNQKYDIIKLLKILKNILI